MFVKCTEYQLKARCNALAKIDKTKLSKSEWHKLREFRRAEKELVKEEKTKENKAVASTRVIPSQPANVIDELPQTKPKKEKQAVPTEKLSSTAFVLGNGTSRLSIEPEWLRPHGKIYGCNALYRTFDPDYLVAVDVKMVLELNKAGYQRKNRNVWTNPNRSYSKFSGFNFFNPSKGWSSGPTALWLAAQHGYEKIYILGFDFRGLKDGQKFNNVYADTPNYKKSTDAATFFGNWMRQTQNVIRENKNIQFVRVIASDNYCPPELNKIENYNTINIDDFRKKFDSPPK